MAGRPQEDARAPRTFSAKGDALLAEFAVERLLDRHHCAYEREVQLPNGHTADFHVERDRASLHLHVKWLSAAEQEPRLGPIPRVLRELEQLERPIEVALRWRPGAGCSAFRRMVREVMPFLRAARISDERIVRDANDRAIGAVRVIGPAPRGAGVRLVDARIFDQQTRQAVRVARLLRKATVQFMPRSTNVILIVSADPLDVGAVESALLGSIVERWDLFPARGDRTAVGRADDGFWSLGRSSASRVVAWLRAGDGAERAVRRAALRTEGRSRAHRSALWVREGARLPDAVAILLRELFA